MYICTYNNIIDNLVCYDNPILQNLVYNQVLKSNQLINSTIM